MLRKRHNLLVRAVLRVCSFLLPNTRINSEQLSPPFTNIFSTCDVLELSKPTMKCALDMSEETISEREREKEREKERECKQEINQTSGIMCVVFANCFVQRKQKQIFFCDPDLDPDLS
jgi:hypothetical protein